MRFDNSIRDLRLEHEPKLATVSNVRVRVGVRVRVRVRVRVGVGVRVRVRVCERERACVPELNA